MHLSKQILFVPKKSVKSGNKEESYKKRQKCR